MDDYGHAAVVIAALNGLATVEVERAIERERHIAELDALACDTVATRPIREAVDAWINGAPDRTLRRLAKRLEVDAGYLSRLIGRSRLPDYEVGGQRVRGTFRLEMPLADAERVVQAVGRAPVELRAHGL